MQTPGRRQEKCNKRNIPLVDASYLTSNTLSFNKMPAAAFGIQMRQAGIFGPINIP